MNDEERVDELIKRWSGRVFVKESFLPEIRADLLDLLRDSHDNTGPDENVVRLAYGRVEVRARELLSQLAPRGTLVTPALIAKVKKEIVELIAEELKAAGVQEGTAQVLAGLMAVAINVKGKP